MAVRKIRGRWWVDFRHEFTRYRKKSPATNREGALAYEATLRGRLARGEPLEVASAKRCPTLAEFSARWFSSYVNQNKPSEQATKRIIFRAHILPTFGRTPLDQITTERIAAYQAEKQRQGLSNKTINNHLAALSCCLRVAMEWGEIERKPKIAKLRVPPPEFDFLTSEETAKLLATAGDEYWKTMVLFAARTGLRRGELMGLDWSCLNLYAPRPSVHVRQALVLRQLTSPKSHKPRVVPLTPDVVQALGALPWRTGFVFGREGGQKPQRPENVRLALHRLCDEAGMRRIGWHVLRHSFASQLVASGVPLRAVQELLGHSDITVTMRYAHLEPSLLHEAVQRLDAAHLGAGLQAVNRRPAPAERYEARVSHDILGNPWAQEAHSDRHETENAAKVRGKSTGSGAGTRTRENESSELGEGQRDSAEVGQDGEVGAVAF